MKGKLVFLIPALNEEEAIGQTINKIKNLKTGLDFEVVIVDGGSKDNTIKIAQGHGARVIRSKKGYGKQYKFALKQLNCDYVITGDADATYPFDQACFHLKKYVLGKGYDFLTTNRFAALEKGAMSLSHILGNHFLTFLTNILFGIHLKDSQSGMWIFKLDKYKKLNVKDNDMAFSEEIKIEAFKKLKRVKEVPISYYKRVGESKLNYSHAVKNTLFLFKKFINDFLL